MKLEGKCSWFGGPADAGVSPSEGLAFLFSVDDKPHLFLPEAPIDPETGETCTGLARRLDPEKFYIACRWDYDEHPKEQLAGDDIALVRAPLTGRTLWAHPSDWGPHEEKTGGRVADLSPALIAALGIETDDVVQVIYPAGEAFAASLPNDDERSLGKRVADLEDLVADLRMLIGGLDIDIERLTKAVERLNRTVGRA
jgi:hypothetical protein